MVWSPGSHLLVFRPVCSPLALVDEGQAFSHAATRSCILPLLTHDAPGGVMHGPPFPHSSRLLLGALWKSANVYPRRDPLLYSSAHWGFWPPCGVNREFMQTLSSGLLPLQIKWTRCTNKILSSVAFRTFQNGSELSSEFLPAGANLGVPELLS